MDAIALNLLYGVGSGIGKEDELIGDQLLI